ncbi:DUF3068 domain-containing protein [Corynebacterium sp. YIM 101645]|uniref:DUF3068 domain-containing protein n=1 Tax=Corynebacterium lemuris TaxID=1859292 RepID=A0ABT2FZ79_9CORY|nr:DUF3068 domain-containing protein [Corynebacterium lemuris]MCS5480546.1 DUF3068 domain-containing protein [Corynebacterium lemuris]
MTQSVFRRPPIRLLLLLAVVTFLLGSLVPPLLISQMKPLPTDLQTPYRSNPAETVMLAPTAMTEGAVPEENRARAECREGTFPDVPYSCLVVETPTHRELTVATSAAPARDEVDITATRQLHAEETLLAEVSDTLRLDRRSTYPVSDPVSELSVTIPALDLETTTGFSVREGLQYFFPFPPERRSYPRYDTVAGRPLLLDYVGEVERAGLETFEFHHTFTALPLTAPDDNRPRQEETEDSVFTTLEAWGLGSVWYAVDRTVWVEPKSGTLVDTQERIHIYFAADHPEAEERAFIPAPEFSILHTSATWDGATVERQHERAAGVASRLRVLQVSAVALKTVALAAVIWAVVLLLRERRGRTS